jgi:hypothetical protein
MAERIEQLRRIADGAATGRSGPIQAEGMKPAILRKDSHALAAQRVDYSQDSGKSRSGFAAIRGGVFSLYTIPLRRLLGDGRFCWQLGRAVPSPTAEFLRRDA